MGIKEKIEAAVGITAATIVALGMAVAFIVLIGNAFETVVERQVQQERCLKEAASAYEARNC